MRVFLDTNVLVSAFATRGLCADVLRVVLAEHELMIGEVNIQELTRVLLDKMAVPAGVVRGIEDLLLEQSVIPKPAAPSAVRIRDEDDAWVLASAEAGNAEVLVTGDRDLLDVAAKTSIRILDPRGFWAARPASCRLARGFSTPLEQSSRSRAWRPQGNCPSRPSMSARA